MKKLNKVVLSAFMLIMVFSLISTVDVEALGQPDQIIDVSGDSIQTQLESNVMTLFQFRERTQLTFSSNVEIDLNLNCETNRIMDKDFIIEIESGNNLQMIMTCTREEQQLGLMEGYTYRVRNRNTFRYQEGFCVTIECNPRCDCDCPCECLNECQCVCDCECQCVGDCQCDCDCPCECLEECQCICDCLCQNECQCECNCEDKTTCISARLRIRVTNENRYAKWAYYDENSEEWATAPTFIEEGYLTVETDHFSTWTVLIPALAANNTILIIGSSAAILAIGALIWYSIIHSKKSK
ncbi:MAG: hypothetical protein ACFE9Z_03420 [Promethearchaeota archaeon]